MQDDGSLQRSQLLDQRKKPSERAPQRTGPFDKVDLAQAHLHDGLDPQQRAYHCPDPVHPTTPVQILKGAERCQNPGSRLHPLDKSHDLFIGRTALGSLGSGDNQPAIAHRHLL